MKGVELMWVSCLEMATNQQTTKYTFMHVKLLRTVEYGGGTLLYSSTSSDFTDLGNEIKFECSTWRGNTAIFGAGINIATHTWDTLKRGLLPLPVFIDCTFESNYVINNYVNSIDEHHLEGKAAFITIGVDVKFKKEIPLFSITLALHCM